MDSSQHQGLAATIENTDDHWWFQRQQDFALGSPSCNNQRLEVC
jgi:hypothetical protein